MSALRERIDRQNAAHAAALVVSAAGAAFLACGNTSGDIDGSGETHFLASCDTDAVCGEEFSCLCGVCTKACDSDAACSAWGGTCSAMCSSDLEELDRILDGAELRLAFRDGIACDGPPTDVGVSMTLSLSTTDLTSDVTGCAVSGPEGNVFQRLFQMANRY
jgi:hypothetical protein